MNAVNPTCRFDLSDVVNSCVGIACTEPSILNPEESITLTRFASVVRLTADDRGLCLVVEYGDGELEAVHHSRVTYVDGRFIP